MKKLVYYLMITLAYFCMSLGFIDAITWESPINYYVISSVLTVVLMIVNRNKIKLGE